MSDSPSTNGTAADAAPAESEDDMGARSPRVTGVSWGTLEVEGRDRPYKDAKLWPGGSRTWDWNETGTSHSPGIQIADVRELVDNGAETVILSRGMNRRLQVQDETVEWLEERGVEAEILQTEKAVERYNELSERAPVGALIHSTC